MAVELQPLGVSCNVRCRYCYQNPLRDAGGPARSYDLEKMKAAIEAEGGPFVLFGGEPLLLPAKDLEELWAWGLERYGANAVQTNGVLIDESHLRLFERYRVAVGISVDGPGELNDARWAGDLERTRDATARSHAAIERLCAAGRPPGLIVTLHRGNASRDRLPAMHAWIRRLEELGVTSVRLHLLAANDGAARRYALGDRENVEALLSFAGLEEGLEALRFDLFTEARDLLLGKDWDAGCVWTACDPFTTRAVRGVGGQGQRSHCGRTNRDGIDYLKADDEGFERYLALFRTPQEHGGCQGCRFFLQCRGQCPGTAIDGDWRNRSEHCEVWKALFHHFEAELIAEGREPLSVSPERQLVETDLLGAWTRGTSPPLFYLLGRRSSAATAPSSSPPPLPEFTRISWASQAARDLWQPRIERIRRAWAEIEWRSVVEGIRPCSMPLVSPEALAARSGTWEQRGLRFLTLEKVGVSGSAYASRAVDLEDGKPFRLRVALGRPGDAGELRRAWEAGEEGNVGEILGYPPCCTDFFQQHWVEKGRIDTTWPAAVASAGGAGVARILEIAGTPEANMLWRCLGVRTVPHLPCRFDCRPTVELGGKLTQLGRALGFAEEMEWLREVLSCPVEWSALHGIAELKTPVLKVATRTDATLRRYKVVARVQTAQRPQRPVRS